MLCDMEKEVIDGDATGATVKKSNVITRVKEGKSYKPQAKQKQPSDDDSDGLSDGDSDCLDDGNSDVSGVLSKKRWRIDAGWHF